MELVQKIMDFLNGDAMGKIIVGLMALNALISAVQMFIEKLQALALVKDSAILNILAKVAAVLSKILDFISANRKHPEAPKP